MHVHRLGGVSLLISFGLRDQCTRSHMLSTVPIRPLFHHLQILQVLKDNHSFTPLASFCDKPLHGLGGGNRRNFVTIKIFATIKYKFYKYGFPKKIFVTIKYKFYKYGSPKQDLPNNKYVWFAINTNYLRFIIISSHNFSLGI